MKTMYNNILRQNEVKATFLFELAQLLATRNGVTYEYFARTNQRDRKAMAGRFSEAGFALIDKLEHMIFNRGGMQPAVNMLYSFRFGKKRLHTCPSEWDAKELYEYRDVDGNEKLSHSGNQPNAHFRWNNGNRYELNENELAKIEAFLGNVNPADFHYNERKKVKKVMKSDNPFEAFMQATKTSVTLAYKGMLKPNWADTERPAYDFTVSNPKGSFGGVFYGSLNNNAVTAEDIMCHLEKYEPDDFANFCNELDYNFDSISDKETYNAVVAEYNNMRRLFTIDELETLQEIF